MAMANSCMIWSEYQNYVGWGKSEGCVKEATSGLTEFCVGHVLSIENDLAENEEICKAARVFLAEMDRIQPQRQKVFEVRQWDCSQWIHFSRMYFISIFRPTRTASASSVIDTGRKEWKAKRAWHVFFEELSVASLMVETGFWCLTLHTISWAIVPNAAQSTHKGSSLLHYWCSWTSWRYERVAKMNCILVPRMFWRKHQDVQALVR